MIKDRKIELRALDAKEQALATEFMQAYDAKGFANGVTLIRARLCYGLLDSVELMLSLLKQDRPDRVYPEVQGLLGKAS